MWCITMHTGWQMKLVELKLNMLLNDKKRYLFYFFLMDIGTDHQALEENGLQQCPYKSLLKKEPKLVSVKPK